MFHSPNTALKISPDNNFSIIVIFFFQNTFYSDCIVDDGPDCDRFIEEECEYAGEHVHHPKIGTIVDPDHCAETCKIFHYLNCNYWIYFKSRYDCILLDSSTRKCASVSGPKTPNVRSCIGKYSE